MHTQAFDIKNIQTLTEETVIRYWKAVFLELDGFFLRPS